MPSTTLSSRLGRLLLDQGDQAPFDVVAATFDRTSECRPHFNRARIPRVGIFQHTLTELFGGSVNFCLAFLTVNILSEGALCLSKLYARSAGSDTG